LELQQLQLMLNVNDLLNHMLGRVQFMGNEGELAKTRNANHNALNRIEG